MEESFKHIEAQINKHKEILVAQEVELELVLPNYKVQVIINPRVKNEYKLFITN